MAKKEETTLPMVSLPKEVEKAVKDWLGPKRGIAGTSDWNGSYLTVVSWPDYQKETFHVG